MWFELVDADWFEQVGMNADMEAVKAHYESININPSFAIKIFNIFKIEFEQFYNFELDGIHYRFGLFETNELIFQIFVNENTRTFYSDNVRQYLFDLKMICGLTINSDSEILALADYVKYDMWFFNKCCNKD